MPPSIVNCVSCQFFTLGMCIYDTSCSFLAPFCVVLKVYITLHYITADSSGLPCLLFLSNF